jgi:hypothetical protein
MPPRVQLQVKREGTGILLGDYKKMRTAKAKKQLSEFEQAVMTLYELLLYRQTDQMSPADAALVETAALTHRAPIPQTLPSLPDV